ncbi:MAG TPA: CHAT domain-containing protein [Noviherbaspirillum sp.]|nr:CHAT domain-containing protein [Noviherbaspirillum sp.]
MNLASPSFIGAGVTPLVEAADVPSSFNDAYARLQPLVWPSLLFLREKKAVQALKLLEEARGYIEENPQERWPFRLYVLPPFGFALLVLGRNAEAVEVLTLAVQTYERVQAENLTTYKQILFRSNESQGKAAIKAEFNRQLLSIVPTASGPLPTVAELMFDCSIGSSDIFFSLGRALRETGHVKELATLYENHVKPQADAKISDFEAIVTEYRLFKFAVLLFQADRPDIAEKALELALRMNTDRFADMRVAGSPVELVWSSFIRQRTIASALFQIVGQTALDEPKSGQLLPHLLRAKGGAVRYVERLNQLLDRSENENVRRLRTRMFAIEDQIAALPPTEMGLALLFAYTAQHGQHMIQAIRQLNAPASLDFNSVTSLNLPQIRRHLYGNAVVGFILYTPLAHDKFGVAPTCYLRYCITADQLQLLDVGEQHAIDRTVRAFRLDLISGGNGSQSGKALAQRLLTNLPRNVETAKQWIIDPDGMLCLVPFEALPETDARLGIELRSYRYVTSIEQIEPLPPQTKQQAHACIIANPSYGVPGTDTSAGSGQAQVRSPANLLDLRDFSVAELPDTAQEAQAVAGALERIGIQVERFEGARATSGVLRSVQSPAVLHIASHAMIFSPNKMDNDWSVDDPNLADPHRAVELVLPGRHAGLVLSRGDGPELLLAKDITRLPLQDTALVVLSACNTGNGDVVPGEGVASLRRSVELAGARSSVTSLWAVPSQATTELMASFYQHLGHGIPLAEALRQAKLQKARQGRPPVEWAGFLFAGRDDILFSNGRRTT